MLLVEMLQRQTEEQRWTKRFPKWARDVLVSVNDWRGMLQSRMEDREANG